jgi:hypothetical protein
MPLTYESDVDILETCIVLRSYCDIAFESVHGGIRSDPCIAWPISAIDDYLNSGLAVMGHVTDFGPDLVSHSLHCGRMRVL